MANPVSVPPSVPPSTGFPPPYALKMKRVSVFRTATAEVNAGLASPCETLANWSCGPVQVLPPVPLDAPAAPPLPEAPALPEALPPVPVAVPPPVPPDPAVWEPAAPPWPVVTVGTSLVPGANWDVSAQTFESVQTCGDTQSTSIWHWLRHCSSRAQMSGEAQ